MTAPTIVDIARDAQRHATHLGELSTRVTTLCENVDSDPTAALEGFQTYVAAYDATLAAISRMETFAANNPLSFRHRMLVYMVHAAVKPLRELRESLQALVDGIEEKHDEQSEQP